MFGRQRNGPIRAWIGPKRANLVPHTGIAANVRPFPAEYGCYGGLWPAPVGPDRVGGTNEGTSPNRSGMRKRLGSWIAKGRESSRRVSTFPRPVAGEDLDARIVPSDIVVVTLAGRIKTELARPCRADEPVEPRIRTEPR